MILQLGLECQKADSSEQETGKQSQPVAKNTAILPEETASMSEDELNRLLQQSQEQSGNVRTGATMPTMILISKCWRMCMQGLSNILDQVTLETAHSWRSSRAGEEDKCKVRKKEKRKEATSWIF